jgi:hypothetical protein
LDGLFGKGFRLSERNWKLVHVKWVTRKQDVAVQIELNLLSACLTVILFEHCSVNVRKMLKKRKIFGNEERLSSALLWHAVW